MLSVVIADQAQSGKLVRWMRPTVHSQKDLSAIACGHKLLDRAAEVKEFEDGVGGEKRADQKRQELMQPQGCAGRLSLA